MQDEKYSLVKKFNRLQIKFSSQKKLYNRQRDFIKKYKKANPDDKTWHIQPKGERPSINMYFPGFNDNLHQIRFHTGSIRIY